MGCYCKILHISYKDHVTNEEVRAKIQQTITTWRSLDDRKATQNAVVWSCPPFIRSGQNHLARYNERGKKTRQTKEDVGRQHQGVDSSGFHQVPEGSGDQGKMEKTGCKIICGAPTTLTVKGSIFGQYRTHMRVGLRAGTSIGFCGLFTHHPMTQFDYVCMSMLQFSVFNLLVSEHWWN